MNPTRSKYNNYVATLAIPPQTKYILYLSSVMLP